MHLWLIGMMGSGKSTVGRLAAKRLQRKFVDLDREVESRARTTVARIFDEAGEPAFRRLESSALAAAARSSEPSVIATGGGAILSDSNVRAMRATGRVVWLRAKPSTLGRRVGRGTSRPLLRSSSLEKILTSRAPRYARAANEVISTDGRSASAIAGLIAAMAAPTSIDVGGPEGGYTVRVGYGILHEAAAMAASVARSGKAIVVADAAVARLHGKTLEKALHAAGLAHSWLEVPGGERSKTLATVAKIWKGMLGARIDRSTPVIAFGGGVIGDLAGFAAATVLRGVPLIQVPTTLVAQVDSSIGGKTGFDFASGKNLIGAFKRPIAVIADLDLLGTLPARELRAGLGEVVKYGAIADAVLFRRLEHLGREAAFASGISSEIVRRCIAIKAQVVTRDPFERGFRGILNFGHTVGHAIEAASGFGQWRHGEAVAAGMVAEAELAVSRGRCKAEDAVRLAGLVHELGLPLEPGAAKKLGRFVGSDKKRVGAIVKMPLLRKVGRVEMESVPLSDVVKFLGNR